MSDRISSDGWVYDSSGAVRHKDCHLCGGLVIQTQNAPQVWFGSHDVGDCLLTLSQRMQSYEDRIDLLESENSGLRDDLSLYRSDTSDLESRLNSIESELKYFERSIDSASHDAREAQRTADDAYQMADRCSSRD